MVIFFLIAIYILDTNNRSMAYLFEMREMVLRPHWALEQMEVAGRSPPPWWHVRAAREHAAACAFCEYLSMRREFIHGRKPELPHLQRPQADWLPLDFNYARYLAINLGSTIAKTIDVDSWTWFQLWLLNVATFGVLWVWPPKGQNAIVACSAWVALGYVEAFGMHLFYHSVQQVRWCMCCPPEVPHLEFTVPDPSSGIPVARPRASFAAAPGASNGGGCGSAPGAGISLVRVSDGPSRRGYDPIPDGDAEAAKQLEQLGSMDGNAHNHYEIRDEMRKIKNQASIAEAPKMAGGSPQRAAQTGKSRSSSVQQAVDLIAAEEAQLDLADRGSPPWASIVVDLARRTKWQQWVGGRAPFRQLYLFWHQGNGPELNVAILRLHLVYLSIQITVLCLVFAPLIKEHWGPQAWVLYLLSPVPHVAYTMSILGHLTRVVTEIGCVGVLTDQKVKKEVLRMMKTEKSVKGLMLLTNMKHFVGENKRKASAKHGKHGHGKHGHGPKKSEHEDEGFLERVSREVWEDKFDTQCDGAVGPGDFAVGLALLATFSEAEAALAFKQAEGEGGQVDLLDFTRFFKLHAHASAWKGGKEGVELGVAARLHAAFAQRVERAAAKDGKVELTAEAELALLHREHGRAVHEIVMIFDTHDVNGDGTLQADEVQAMIRSMGQDMSDSEAKQLVGHLDRDGDGEVSMAEFVIWAFRRQQATESEDMEEVAGEIFDAVFDITSDGKIDVNEFIIGLEKIKSDLSYEEKHELFREADENGGGYIDREEFVALMTKYS